MVREGGNVFEITKPTTIWVSFLFLVPLGMSTFLKTWFRKKERTIGGKQTRFVKEETFSKSENRERFWFCSFFGALGNVHVFENFVHVFENIVPRRNDRLNCRFLSEGKSMVGANGRTRQSNVTKDN